MRIAMVGARYVGLVTGTCFAETGNNVTCIDNDPRKIAILNDGGVPCLVAGLWIAGIATDIVAQQGAAPSKPGATAGAGSPHVPTVQLQANGVFSGVLSVPNQAGGVRFAQTKVVIVQHGQQVASVLADARGHFELSSALPMTQADHREAGICRENARPTRSLSMQSAVSLRIVARIANP